jgi:hypothetical protein
MKNVSVLVPKDYIPEIINYCRWEISRFPDAELNRLCENKDNECLSINGHNSSWQFTVQKIEPETVFVEFIGSAS